MVALREYCKSRGWVIGGEFSDCVNASCRLRPGLKALFRQLDEGGSFSAVMVFKLDRLARGEAYLLEIVRRILRSGTTLISVSEDIHTTELLEGEELARRLGRLGEIESQQLKARIQSGLNRARAEGKVLGRPKL